MASKECETVNQRIESCELNDWMYVQFINEADNLRNGTICIALYEMKLRIELNLNWITNLYIKLKLGLAVKLTQKKFYRLQLFHFIAFLVTNRKLPSCLRWFFFALLSDSGNGGWVENLRRLQVLTLDTVVSSVCKTHNSGVRVSVHVRL